MKTDYCVYVHVSPNGKHYVRQTGQKFWKRWNNGSRTNHVTRERNEKGRWIQDNTEVNNGIA